MLLLKTWRRYTFHETSRCIKDRRPVSRNPRKLFVPLNPLFSSSDLITQKFMRLKRMYCMQRISVHNKNTWVKQLCYHKVRDVAKIFRVRKRFGTFEKQVPATFSCISTAVCDFSSATSHSWPMRLTQISEINWILWVTNFNRKCSV